MKTKQMLGLVALIGGFSATGGCGTVTTVLQEDRATVQSLKAKKTYCQSVPRVYSGVAYGLCALHAPPNSGSGLWLNSVPWAFIDVPLSGVLDTLVLPYTVYQQNVEGSLELR
ncbi:MAG: YceK/YidQ family lipoprotein [Pseudomonas sp.]|uniref:YceK/YidQ family lipoprotein n=1 Tax=Pseudomonas sp. TaxID=306 RepID=UPI00391B2595